MRCNEIMRRPVRTVAKGATVQSAAQTMRDANIGFVPVCDENGRTIGIVTDRDLAIRACASDLPAGRTAIEDVMSPQVVSCREGDDLGEVEMRMERHHKSRILVVDDAERPVGVISLADLAQRASGEGSRVLREVSRREVLGRDGDRARERR